MAHCSIIRGDASGGVDVSVAAGVDVGIGVGVGVWYVLVLTYCCDKSKSVLAKMTSRLTMSMVLFLLSS
jgi:hypothetical protein